MVTITIIIIIIIIIISSSSGGGSSSSSSSSSRSRIYHTQLLLTAKETNLKFLTDKFGNLKRNPALLLPMCIHTLRKRRQDRPATELLRRSFFPTLRRLRLQGCQFTDSKHWRCRRYTPSKRRKAITRTHRNGPAVLVPQHENGFAITSFSAVLSRGRCGKGPAWQGYGQAVSPFPPLSCLLHNRWWNTVWLYYACIT